MKKLIIIPAYNEASTIREVLVEMPAGYHVVVINDGSHDDTAEITRRLGVRVVSHPINRGLGGALRTGFQYALQHGYDVVVTLDADGQHDVRDIPTLMACIEAGADVVIGRRNTSHMPMIRRVYNSIALGMTRVLFGSPSVDTQSGFRAIRSEALKKMMLRSSRMEISSEIVAEAYRVRLAIHQAPITVRYTEYSMSKGQSLFEGARTAWRLFLRSLN